jgi:hypothetical protein
MKVTNSVVHLESWTRLVGSARAVVAERRWFPAGVEMLGIGMIAGAVAYGVGIFGAALTGGAK